MRCPDCNKFVSFDSDGEPEIDVDIADKTVTGSARITNNCAECGTELKEANFDINVDAVGEHEDCDGELEVSVEDPERTDRMETKTRTGKPIKNMRHMKHLYGAQATLKVECPKCNFSEDIEWSDEVAGSEMDELV